MADVKRIMISLPESLLAEVDGIVNREKRNRSEFIRDALHSLLLERKRRSMREQMIKGYKEMAQINLSLAREHFETETEAQQCYEKKLLECN
ncbi:MAG TPA: ribbon-helix-helix protein, CopG family [Desulfobacteria bacterium]|nr:ribbon-helix-helix protein, CopG family [Desulfobacteria bacterium]